MKESVTYQAIIDEGAAAEAHRMLLSLRSRRFGEPTMAVRARIERETSLDRLETLTLRALDVETWDELFSDNAS